MSYRDCETTCVCGEECEGTVYFECDECDECDVLEKQIEELKEEIQECQKNETKIEEYDRLKTWLLDNIKAKPSDLMLGIDHYLIKKFKSSFGKTIQNLFR